MDKIKLSVEVVRDQLDKLQKDVESLKSQKISLDVTTGTSGSGGKSGIAKLNEDAQGAIVTLGELRSGAERFVTVTKGGSEQAERAMAKYVDETGKATDVTAKLDKQTGQYSVSQTKVTENLGKQAKQTQEVAKETNKLTEAFSNMGKMAAWQISGMIVSKAIGSFREALQTMKEVDAELTNIQKVTDATDAEIARLGDTAYKTASAYGVAANDYLSSVATFAKAGYGENADALGELATKTQLVGDVTSEVASKFLISSDAAWKMNGSIADLTQVLDAANWVENNYATSIDKIAQGFPIVANTAAQAGLSMQETVAMLGTITATTQESGTKAATALRAILLNLIGQTGEFEDGITVTKESIEDLNGILQVYAADAVKAAQATGTIVNPMEAIAGLAKAAEEGVLNQAELFELLSSLGGKLRTNQLTALVTNFDMLQGMLEGMGASAGSADREVGIMLDSWESKTNILQNTWTEFVSHVVDTNAIKGSIDALTGVIRFLDSGIGKAAVTFGLLTVAANLGSKAIAAIGSSSLATTLQMQGLLVTAEELAITLATNPLTWIAGAVALLGALQKASEENATSIEELQASIEERENNLKTLEEERAGILSNPVLTDAEKDRLSILNAEIAAEDELLKRDKEREYHSQFQQTVRFNNPETGEKMTYIGTADTIRKDIDAYNDLSDAEANTAEQREKIREQQAEYIQSFTDTANALQAYKDAGVELSRSDEVLLFQLNKLIAAYGEEAGALDAAGGKYADRVADLFDLEGGLEDAKIAIEEFNAALQGGEKGDTFSAYADIYDKFLEHFNAGEFGSNEYQAAIKAFLPDNILAEVGDDWEAAGKMLASDFWRATFAEGGEDHGAAFMQILSEIADAEGKVYDESGNLVARFEDLGDSQGMTITNFEELAKYLGTTEEVVRAAYDALGIFGEQTSYTGEDVLDLARDMNALYASAEETTVSVNDFVRKLADGSASKDQITAMLEELQKMDGVTLVGVQGSISETVDAIMNAQTQTDTETSKMQTLDDQTASPSVTLDTSGFDNRYSLVMRRLREMADKSATIKIGANAEGTSNFAGGLSLVNEEGPELIEEDGTARIAGGGEPTVTYVKPGATIYTAEETSRMLNGNRFSGVISAFAGGTVVVPKKVLPSYSKSTSVTTKSVSKRSAASSSASSAAKSNTSISDRLKPYKDAVSLLESELDLLEAQDASTASRIDKIHEIQNSIQNQLNYMRAIGASQEEINDLTAKWYKWEDEIKKLQDDMWDRLEDAINGELKEAKKIRDAELDALEAEMDALEKQRDTKSEQLDLDEKILAVEKAQADLRNAENNRNIRIFNSATGQWEWTANASNVQSARDALTNAQNALDEYRENAEYQALVDAINARKEAVNAEYDALESNWKQITDSLQEPTETVAEVLSYIANNATPEMAEQIEYVNSLLARFGYSIGGTNNGRIYDSGGLLTGMGGLKAVASPEGILSPALTHAMLQPTASETFAERMSELSYLYGGTNRAPASLYGSSGTHIGSQHNGDVYTFGSITLTKDQARGMTVYDLAQQSRILAISRSNY